MATTKGAGDVFDAIAQHLSLLGLGSFGGGLLSFAVVEAAETIDGLPPASGSIGVVSALLFLIAYLWRVIKRQDKRIAQLEHELDVVRLEAKHELDVIRLEARVAMRRADGMQTEISDIGHRPERRD